MKMNVLLVSHAEWPLIQISVKRTLIGHIQRSRALSRDHGCLPKRISLITTCSCCPVWFLFYGCMYRARQGQARQKESKVKILEKKVTMGMR